MVGGVPTPRVPTRGTPTEIGLDERGERSVLTGRATGARTGCRPAW